MSNSKLLLAFIGGAAAGAAISLLFTSEKGSEIRREFMNKAKEFADTLLTKAEEILDEAETSAAKPNSEKV